MNSYTFPDNVQISENSRNIISKILILDPSKRPTLDEIVAHPFLNNGIGVPKALPIGTLACPPPSYFVKQFQVQANQGKAEQDEDKEKTMRKIPEVNLDAAQSPGNEGRYNQSVKALANFQNLSPNLYGSSDHQSQRQNTLGIDEVWVKKWVDYTQKYGLGYILSNGSTGVYFNDSTKIVASGDYQTFDYYEKKGTNKQDIGVSYSLTEYPKELVKKVILLNHFKNYLIENQKEDLEENNKSSKSPKQMIYVKKWMKTKYATLFRLNNRIVQVSFTDKTEILLNSDMKSVSYLNKKGERTFYPLASALDSSNVEMTKRLRYTKDVLMQLLTSLGKDKMEKLIKEPIDIE